MSNDTASEPVPEAPSAAAGVPGPAYLQRENPVGRTLTGIDQTVIHVAQLSDTHVSTGAARSHGGLGYDVGASFDAVLGSLVADAHRPDMVVVTGDVADRGQPSEYELAGRMLSRLPAAVHVLGGNHDYAVPMESVLPRPGISLTRSLRLDNWLFLFVDSSGGRVRDRLGRLLDTPGRVGSVGRLDPAELSWIDDMVGCTDAEHVFLWLHHAPAMPGVFANEALDRDASDLLERHRSIRGLAGGHVHTDLVTQVVGRPVFVCPSLTINVDLRNVCALPPGYRTFQFGPDGSIGSTCYLLDRPEWPRTPFPDEVRDYLDGHIDLVGIETAAARWKDREIPEAVP